MRAAQAWAALFIRRNRRNRTYRTDKTYSAPNAGRIVYRFPTDTRVTGFVLHRRSSIALAIRVKLTGDPRLAGLLEIVP